MKKAFITGASSGIGFEFGKQIEEMYEVYNFSRTKSIFQDTYIDFSNKNSYLKLAEKVYKEKPSLIVLNAGVANFGLAQTFLESRIKEEININYVFNASFLSAIQDYLIENDVNILVVTSISAYLTSPYLSSYAASKSALSSFIKSFYSELVALGSRSKIQEFAPGNVEGTKLFGTQNEKDSKLVDYVRYMVSNIGKEYLIIPQYDEVYANILYENKADFLEFWIKIICF